jgi:hypothetical protein
MKKIFVLYLFFLATVKNHAQENIISDSNNQAFGPSFTTTSDGKIILSFVEKDAQKRVKFYFCYFDGNKFGPKNYVPIVDSASTHAEGMPRLAVKKDGSMIVTFEIKKENSASRFG